VSMGLVGSAGSPRTLRVLHCTEVSQSMSQMGHSRHFGRASGTSGLPPTSDMSLHRSAMPRGLTWMASAAAVAPAVWRS
jgi:hypothetical protein